MPKNAATHRIDARIPAAVKETIDRAAALYGRTRTDFLIEAAMEKAERILAEHSLLRLTEKDQKFLAEILTSEKTAPPNRHVRRAAREYSRLVDGE